MSILNQLPSPTSTITSPKILKDSRRFFRDCESADQESHAMIEYSHNTIRRKMQVRMNQLKGCIDPPELSIPGIVGFFRRERWWIASTLNSLRSLTSCSFFSPLAISNVWVCVCVCARLSVCVCVCPEQLFRLRPSSNAFLLFSFVFCYIQSTGDRLKLFEDSLRILFRILSGLFQDSLRILSGFLQDSFRIFQNPFKTFSGFFQDSFRNIDQGGILLPRLPLRTRCGFLRNCYLIRVNWRN